MSWDAIAAIAELLGAIGVIVTVGYLALQVRQNTSALRSTATQGAHDQAADIYRTLAADPDLAMIFVRGSDAPDELSAAETARYFSFWQYVLFNFQNWYLQTQDHLIDARLLSSWSRVYENISGTRGFKYFWEQRAFIYSPEFREYIEALMTKHGQAGYRPLGVSQKEK